MSSSFFGLHVAATGLNASQAAINVTANNISNINTEGYSRQTVSMVANTAQRTYQSWGTLGTGVSIESITQSRDLYYDEKYWVNNSRLGTYEKRLYYMEQIENYFTDEAGRENGVEGFNTLYSKMFNALDSLSQGAGDTSRRNEFIASAQSMMDYFNATATSLQDLQSSINDEIKTAVDTVNSIAQKVALLNKQINIVEVQGGEASELRDQRALLIDELSKLVPVEAKEREVTNSNFEDQYTGATYFTVKIGGNLLVDNYEYNTWSVVSRDVKNNLDDVDGLYDVIWNHSGATIDFTASAMEGEFKSMFEVRDGNNGENLTGTVVAATIDSITIKNPNITDFSKMNMPETGRVLCNSTYYTYTTLEFTTDDQGNIDGYTFGGLTKLMNSEEQGSLIGRNLVNGDTVDFKGVPYYQSQLNEFLRTFAKAFNDIETEGMINTKDKMGSFFVNYDRVEGVENDQSESVISRHADPSDPSASALTSRSNTYYRLTASNARVNKRSQTDPSYFAVSVDPGAGVDAVDLVAKLGDLQEKTKYFRNTSGSAFLQCIYADITVDTQEAKTFTNSYTSIVDVIEAQRQSVSSVDEDEEAMNLIKFQNSYNLASKCISVLAEMYDRLILNTGV